MTINVYLVDMPNDRFPEVPDLYNILRSSLHEDLVRNFLQLYQLQVEKKIAVNTLDFMSAATYRDKSRDIARIVIDILDKTYVNTPKPVDSTKK